MTYDIIPALHKVCIFKRPGRGNFAKITQKGQTFGKRQWKCMECKKSIKGRGRKEQLCLGSKKILRQSSRD
jgi:hypothetical protein